MKERANKPKKNLGRISSEIGILTGLRGGGGGGSRSAHHEILADDYLPVYESAV